jgi:hypothetical protein
MRTVVIAMATFLAADVQVALSFTPSVSFRQPHILMRATNPHRCGTKATIRKMSSLSLRSQQEGSGEDDPTKGDWDEYEDDGKRFAYNKGGWDDDQVSAS